MKKQEESASAELTRLLVSQKSVFNVEDLSLYTGLSKSAIYKLTFTRKLRHSKPNGKKVYFQKADVDDFLLSNPIQSIDDIDQEVFNYTSATATKGGSRW